MYSGAADARGWPGTRKALAVGPVLRSRWWGVADRGGAGGCGWPWPAGWGSARIFARAAGPCLLPVAGQRAASIWTASADTCDALSSYGDTAKKLEILKDPHCGAFAVIRLCSYFIAYLALCVCVQFTPRVGVLWTLALVGERALSGLAVAAFPMAKNTGLAHTFATAADKTNVRRVLTVLCVLLGAALVALGGWALALAACAVFVRYYHAAKNQFGGTTGDLAGWFFEKCEIWMLAALAACQWLGVL